MHSSDMGYEEHETDDERLDVALYMVKNLPEMHDLPGFYPRSGRSSREGHGNSLQYSCLENSRDRGAWRAAVHELAKSQT